MSDELRYLEVTLSEKYSASTFQLGRTNQFTFKHPIVNNAAEWDMGIGPVSIDAANIPMLEWSTPHYAVGFSVHALSLPEFDQVVLYEQTIDWLPGGNSNLDGVLSSNGDVRFVWTQEQLSRMISTAFYRLWAFMRTTPAVALFAEGTEPRVFFDTSASVFVLQLCLQAGCVTAAGTRSGIFDIVINDNLYNLLGKAWPTKPFASHRAYEGDSTLFTTTQTASDIPHAIVYYWDWDAVNNEYATTAPYIEPTVARDFPDTVGANDWLPIPQSAPSVCSTWPLTAVLIDVDTSYQQEFTADSGANQFGAVPRTVTLVPNITSWGQFSSHIVDNPTRIVWHNPSITGPVYSFNISMFFKLNKDTPYPLMFTRGSLSSIKIYFRKRPN